jgi:DNA-binding XRE family transcriptional regulator
MKSHESQEKQEQFIELRAVLGMSLETISKEIGIAKSTAIAWEKQFKEDIHKHKKGHFELTLETFELSIFDRANSLKELSDRINREIKDRDLKDIATDKLISLLNDTGKRLDALIERYGTNDTSKPQSIEQFIHSIELNYKKP